MNEETIPAAPIDAEIVPTPEAAVDAVATPEVAPAPRRQFDRGGQRKNSRRPGRRPERPRPEFDQKILSMRRVTRVVAGGRRFSFAVALVAGNRKGIVGVGTGKAGDTALAIDKAYRDARKNMITIALTKNLSIPHDVDAKYSSSVVKIMPSAGRGLVSGGAVRSVLEYAGITDVTSKILSRSKNGLNNARAAMKALASLHPRK